MNTVLDAIGETPLVRLGNLYSECDFRVYAKVESFNPGGSIKDRPARNIIETAFDQGLIDANSTIIESSSGNMGIGLAQVCAYYKLPFICVVDLKTTTQNIAILKAFGAEVDVVSKPDPANGEFLGSRIARVKELLRKVPGSFWPNQYANPANPEAHFRTMREIHEALNGQVDHVFCSVSTCGTMAGCAAYIRTHGLKTRLWAVDAVGSVLFGGPRAKRLLPGHGTSVVPEIYRPGLEDEHVHVTDLDCVRGCRRLVSEEGILAGGSSGGIISALFKVRNSIAMNSHCALVLADRGERYLDTIYSEDWVMRHFGLDSESLLPNSRAVAVSGRELPARTQTNVLRSVLVSRNSSTGT